MRQRRMGPLVTLLLLATLGGCRLSVTESNDEHDSSAIESASTELVLRTAVDDAKLTQISERTDLEVLELYSVDCSDAVLMSGIEKLSQLRKLRIEGMSVSDETVRAIAEIESLEVLNLPETRMTDESLAMIARLPMLQLLRFGSQQVSDHGIAELRNARALRFLHLLHVSISDEGLKAFNGFAQLESLYIDGGTETDEGIRALLTSNPKLHFHRNQIHVADDPNADGH